MASASRVTEYVHMNCMIIVPSLRRAGAETQAVDLANGLSDIGHEVTLVSFESDLSQRQRIADCVHFEHISRRRKYDMSLASRIATVIDERQIEVVNGVMQFATLVGWMAARRSSRGPRLVGAIHTTENRGLKEELLDRVVFRWVLVRCVAVIFVCQFQADYWVRRFSFLRRTASVVYNGVDPAYWERSSFEEAGAALRADLDIPATSFVFACIAAFRPEKGHDMLLEAFASLPESLYLLLAGDGERRPAVEQRVRELGLADRVKFLGNIADVRPLLAASDATVLSSTAVETFSIAMLESMSMEVPMVAPKIGGLAEAIRDGETGRLFRKSDTIGLAECMRRMESDRASTIAMGQAARSLVVERFSFDQMIRETEKILGWVR